ncbi:ATP-binding protein [Mucilaginibacter sp. cycad4]|uniref:ATP-binding protein n=1 Tax=Mucilaginibacter sp. cycad4 TaxID=3342096 RepID=UPI002AAB9C30|nr:ATP-binding protein [Mucilaginibacter gossypii]WPV02192.1 ATP-binding protein [Mucilaginibacter gossypii]
MIREQQHTLPDEIFKVIFENSPGSLLVKADAPWFTIMAASDGYLKITSSVRENILGRSFFEVFPDGNSNPDDVASARHVFTKVAETGLKVDIPYYKYNVYNANTQTYDVRFWSCSNIPFSCGNKVAYILNVVVDITAEVNARQAAMESENRLRLAAEATGFATFDWDLNDEKRYCSPQLAELLGYPADTALTSTDVFNMIHPDDKATVVNAFNEAFKTGIYCYDVRIIWPDSSLHWISIRGKQIPGEGKNCARILGTVLDITESKSDEIRKNDFIAMASHELKTPLTSIKSYIQILAKKLVNTDDSFVINALSKANLQINKMTDLIHGFLDLSRLESGKLPVKPEQFDINELISDTVTEFTQALNSHIINFDSHGVLNVYADRDKIGQVISNFLSNATKYSPRGSTITIMSKTTDCDISVSVTDLGVGIKLKDQKKLFQRFYRVDSDKTMTVSGFGIGLYLSSEIIQRHNGKIGVESTEGEGSTFYFSLPVSPPL